MTNQPSEIGKQVKGVWLPKEERHLVEMLTHRKARSGPDGRGAYQFPKQKALLDLVRASGRADSPWSFLDIGAHVGLWSMWWKDWATEVVAFEPVDYFCCLYTANVGAAKNVRLYPYALGDEVKEVGFALDPENTGATHVANPEDERAFTTMTVPLDDIVASPGWQGRPPVLAMKIDCEGYEEAVLKGAQGVLMRDRPVICVEQKANIQHRSREFESGGAILFLNSLGYKIHSEMNGDFLMRPGGEA